MSATRPEIDTRTVNRTLRRLRRRAPLVAQRAALLAAEGIMGEAQSQDRIPIKTGFLQSSGVVIKERTGVRFGFSASYAAVVHETHKVKPKFLLGAITQEGPRIVRAAIKIAFREKSGATRR